MGGIMIIAICDRCGNADWETLVQGDPETNMVELVWGPEVQICHTCGAVRKPEELLALTIKRIGYDWEGYGS